MWSNVLRGLGSLAPLLEKTIIRKRERFLVPGNIVIAKGLTAPDARLTAKFDTVISE